MKRILAGIIITMLFFLTVIYADDANEDVPSSSVFENYSIEVFNNDEPEINARSAIVIEF